MMGVPITGRLIFYLNAHHKNIEGFNFHLSIVGQYSGSVLAVQKNTHFLSFINEHVQLAMWEEQGVLQIEHIYPYNFPHCGMSFHDRKMIESILQRKIITLVCYTIYQI